VYAWVRVPVIESRDDLPGPQVWLLARRSVSRPAEVTSYLAWVPHTSSLQPLAEVASTRYTVEQCIEQATGETGFDHYAVRRWPSWYHHITLTLLAHAWLADQRQQQGRNSADGAGGADRARGSPAAGDRPPARRPRRA
jgi:SRSO17 transposase